MSPEGFANWWMVFMRAGSMLVLFPVFSATAVPNRIRVALGAMLALLVSPGLPPLGASEFSLWDWISRMVLEVGTGLLFGFLCKMVFFAVETAGAIISTEIGLSMPAGLNPMTNTSGPVPASILAYLASVLWLSLDLHHWMVVGFQRSFEILPIGGASWTEPVLRDFLGWVGQIFVVALQMAAPVMAVSFLISLVFSVLARAVSQMNVFTENFAVRLLAGLIVFASALPLFAQHLANYFGRLPEDLLRIASILAS